MIKNNSFYKVWFLVVGMMVTNAISIHAMEQPPFTLMGFIKSTTSINQKDANKFVTGLQERNKMCETPSKRQETNCKILKKITELAQFPDRCWEVINSEDVDEKDKVTLASTLLKIKFNENIPTAANLKIDFIKNHLLNNDLLTLEIKENNPERWPLHLSKYQQSIRSLNAIKDINFLISEKKIDVEGTNLTELVKYFRTYLEYINSYLNDSAKKPLEEQTVSNQTQQTKKHIYKLLLETKHTHPLITQWYNSIATIMNWPSYQEIVDPIIKPTIVPQAPAPQSSAPVNDPQIPAAIPQSAETEVATAYVLQPPKPFPGQTLKESLDWTANAYGLPRLETLSHIQQQQQTTLQTPVQQFGNQPGPGITVQPSTSQQHAFIQHPSLFSDEEVQALENVLSSKPTVMETNIIKALFALNQFFYSGKQQAHFNSLWIPSVITLALYSNFKSDLSPYIEKFTRNTDFSRINNIIISQPGFTNQDFIQACNKIEKSLSSSLPTRPVPTQTSELSDPLSRRRDIPYFKQKRKALNKNLNSINGLIKTFSDKKLASQDITINKIINYIITDQDTVNSMSPIDLFKITRLLKYLGKAQSIPNLQLRPPYEGIFSNEEAEIIKNTKNTFIMPNLRNINDFFINGCSDRDIKTFTDSVISVANSNERMPRNEMLENYITKIAYNTYFMNICTFIINGFNYFGKKRFEEACKSLNPSLIPKQATLEQNPAEDMMNVPLHPMQKISTRQLQQNLMVKERSVQQTQHTVNPVPVPTAQSNQGAAQSNQGAPASSGSEDSSTGGWVRTMFRGIGSVLLTVISGIGSVLSTIGSWLFGA